MKSAFLLISIALLCSHGVTPQTFWSPQLQDCLTCIVAAYDIHYENDEDADALMCITDAPYEDGSGSGVGYFHLNLPDDFVQENEQDILAGNLEICIEGGVASRSDYTVSYPEGATISVVPQLSVRDFTPNRANGDMTLLAVRVSSRAGEDPGLTADEIEGTVFGTGLNASVANVTSQYEQCSAGNLRFSAATGANINNGVLDVLVDGPFQGGDMVGTLQNEIIAAVEATVGNISQFGKVMFCVPTGSTIPGGEALSGGAWSAFAHINGDISIFQSQNCGRISAAMHEIGHNLGFYHSSKDLDEYGDHTCYMGVGHLAFRWPRQCFNGHKNWLTGWYTSRQISVDPSTNGAYLGRLVAFVEWNNPDLLSSDVVLINVEDVYILFNRRIGPNVESQDDYDLVTVTQGTSSRSYNLAGLNSTQSFAYTGYNGTASTLMIEVCDIAFGTSFDYALVSLYVQGSQSSLCSSTTPAPIALQTLTPSIAPTQKATTAQPVVTPQTAFPSFEPTTLSPDTFNPASTFPATLPPSSGSGPASTFPATLPPSSGSGSTLLTPPSAVLSTYQPSPQAATFSPTRAASIAPTRVATNPPTPQVATSPPTQQATNMLPTPLLSNLPAPVATTNNPTSIATTNKPTILATTGQPSALATTHKPFGNPAKSPLAVPSVAPKTPTLSTATTHPVTRRPTVNSTPIFNSSDTRDGGPAPASGPQVVPPYLFMVSPQNASSSSLPASSASPSTRLSCLLVLCVTWLGCSILW